MKKISLTFKILLIFLLPVIALVYFSFYFVEIKYNNIHESSMYKLSSEIIENFSKLVHNIQMERGLSAGYLAIENNPKYRTKLLLQYKATDNAYEDFLDYVNLKSDVKKDIEEKIAHIARNFVKQIVIDFNNIKNIRTKVIAHKLDFDAEIAYYSNLNTLLIQAIKPLVQLIKKQNNDNCALVHLQYLKESAGLERAYIYNYLLSEEGYKSHFNKIIKLQEEQKDYKEKFVLNASVESILIYNSVLKTDLEQKVEYYRNKFLQSELKSKDASEWFNVSSRRINALEEISTDMLKRYILLSNNIHSHSVNSLYITALLWLFSLISLAFLTYILKKLMENEENFVEELRISAYTFDSHEAMTVTDVNGNIIKVNDAFSRITGYAREEVVGKNPRILKSMKHSDEFYRDMWHKLHTVGRWSDDIYNKRKNGEIYLERLSITAIKDENDITTHYIAQFLDISDLKEAQEEAQHQADHDFLTGLLNRKALLQRLNEEFIKARRHDFLHAFLFIDLDGFKSINDNYGHDTGDKLLVEVSKRLQMLVREEDIISRISGDEFAVILLNMDDSEDEAAKEAKEVAQKILNEINRVFVLNEHKVSIGASIGIKLFPDSEKSIQDVVVHADTAMYQAKNLGKNQFVFFDRAIELRLKHLQLLEEELIEAYGNGEFRFFYQPKVDVNNGSIIGAEALIRWFHPQEGLLLPESFLELAEDIGIIHKIMLLSLRSACELIKESEGVFDGAVSINIVSSELLNKEFENEVMAIIKKYAIEPSRVEFEITETELIRDFDTIIDKIERLKKYGVKFAIDDFGSGYSSITYLRRLPVDSIKIDRSFLAELNEGSNSEVLKMVIAMIKTLNMYSVIEGIENQEQLEFIREIGADFYQGFLFSEAIDMQSFKKLVTNSNASN